ncbi:MAG: HEPN domain-containing protein [Pseudorhizobium pelagicum]|uniref:HEPN domain-containing protein n=1 Tax=Pseudorhizobium pelagicum TaxID=1509405 RepID=UPI00345FFF6A
MRYRVSPHRADFITRTDQLVRASHLAGRKSVPQGVRDLAFQCSILQTSAAVEEYIRSVFEAWAFKLRSLNGIQSTAIPVRTRVAVAKSRLSQHFSALAYTSDEGRFLKKIEREGDLWAFLEGSALIPTGFDGGVVFAERKYPSAKNIKVMFSRIGIDNIFDQISSRIKADAEYRLESFNSIRTALAHANPPQLTYLDVKRNIKNVQELVAAIDRILHKALSSTIGTTVW